MDVELLKILILIDEIDHEKLKEISRKTNLVTFIILIIVAAVALIFIVYLVYLHIKTKKPKRSKERFKGYLTATATITNIEKVPYYVKPYERLSDKSEQEQINSERYSKYSNQQEKSEDDNIGAFDRISRSADTAKKAEIKKFRYNVRYEFSTDSNNLYSGECFVYEENENIKVGNTMEVKYDSTNPMVNYTAYSLPVGM